jgi:hypothetical protein
MFSDGARGITTKPMAVPYSLIRKWLVPFLEKFTNFSRPLQNCGHHALMHSIALGVFLLGLGAGAVVIRLAFHRHRRDLRDDLMISVTPDDDERLRLR